MRTPSLIIGRTHIFPVFPETGNGEIKKKKKKLFTVVNWGSILVKENE